MFGMFGVPLNVQLQQQMFRELERAMREGNSAGCRPAQQQQRQAPQSDGTMRLSVDTTETDDSYTFWAGRAGACRRVT